jgi:hypothetical protein
VQIAGPHNFSSSWMSAGKDEEWVYVDLGAACTFDRVVLSWIRRASEGAVEVSDDAATWTSRRAVAGHRNHRRPEGEPGTDATCASS